MNTANDHHTRHRRRHLRLVDDVDCLDHRGAEDAGAAQPILDEEMRGVTRAVLNTLPEKYRTILILREYEDLSYIEMAEVLGCSIGTVESRLFRARARFKQKLIQMYPEFAQA